MKNILISLSSAALVVTTVQAAIVINPAAWYDASDLTLSNGATVTSWEDKSGNGLDLTAGDAPTFVSSAINGNSAIEFNRSQELKLLGSTVDFVWVAAVMIHTGGNSLSQAVGSQSGAGGNNYTIQLRADLDPDRWQNTNFMNGRDSASTSVFTDEHINPFVTYRQGLGLTNFDFQIGSDRNTSNRGWDGYIGEVIIGNEALSADEKDALEGYLAHKWGTAGALVDGHAYKDSAPTDLTITVVPEPSAFVMGALGGLFLLRRRRA